VASSSSISILLPPRLWLEVVTYALETFEVGGLHHFFVYDDATAVALDENDIFTTFGDDFAEFEWGAFLDKFSP
jgi:hypothetical protein